MARDSAETRNAAWEAVLKRDRLSDGKFVYVAVTTGIYCRPSCPSRRPHRRNVLIFQTSEDAERQGYVACLRCKPGANSLTRAEKSIQVALEYIENHLDEPITLNSLSAVSGLSPNHLQQTFTRIVGLSPKSFLDARRLARFKLKLRFGESITRACYSAGYGSSRALYEKVAGGLGMIPSTYQRGGEGIRIRYAIATARLGPVLIASTDTGVCSVIVGKDHKVLVGNLRQEFPAADIVLDKTFHRKCLATVQSCQLEDPLLSKLSHELRCRIFQTRVWKTLQVFTRQNLTGRTG